MSVAAKTIGITSYRGFIIELGMSPLNNNDGVMSRAEVRLNGALIKAFNYNAARRGAHERAGTKAEQIINAHLQQH